MKPIINKYIPPGRYLAIVICGLIFAKRELNEKEINHECIHIRQGNEMLWLFFYLFYVVEWLIRLIQYKNQDKAYRNISFEREAYANQHNRNYISSRPPWAWIKYLKKKKNDE